MPKTKPASVSEYIDSSPIDGRSVEMKNSEEWSLLEEGKSLKIVQTSTGFGGGENTVSLIFSISSE